MTRKTYAKQVAPECQESPLMQCGFPDFDEHYKDVSIHGNRSFKGYRTDAFKKASAGLEGFSMDLPPTGEAGGLSDAFIEEIHWMFPPEHKQKYGADEINSWIEAIKEFDKTDAAENATCKALDLMTGRTGTSCRRNR